MSQTPKPKPPKTCSVCLIAMQATRTESGTVHRCQRCGLTVTVGPLKPAQDK